MSTTQRPGDTRAADGLPLDGTTASAPDVSGVDGGAEGPFGEAPTSPPPEPPRYARPAESGPHVIWPLLLIALGLVFLFANYVANLGSFLFLAIGAAFLVARIVQRQYAFAIPAGILLGFGTFVALSANGWLVGTATDTTQGGWFFILLGAGFLLVYLLGARPTLVWPLFPAAILGVFGLLLLGQGSLTWFARFDRLLEFWPLVLVGVGLWLLVRSRLAPATRRPVGLIALALLVVYGLATVLGVVASTSLGLATPDWNLRGFGFRPPISETRELNATIAAGSGFHVNNANGNTTIQTGAPGEVRVGATTYRWATDQAIDVRLTPENGILKLTAIVGTGTNFGNTPYVDYTITVPADTPIEVTAASGDIAISDVSAAVVASTSSGTVTLDRIGGAVTARATSGNVRLTNIGGEARATTSSGNIEATGITQPREFVATSGNVVVAGQFTAAARVTASSGNVTLRFAPGSAARIAATTTSGAIRVTGLGLTDRTEAAHTLSGTLGGGTATITVQATSGNVALTSEP